MNINDLFLEYDENKHILIVEVCSFDELAFLTDLKYQNNGEYKCGICNKNIKNLKEKYICNICNYSLFCKEECSKICKEHEKIDRLLKQILEPKFELNNLLSININSLVNNKSHIGRVGLETKENYDFINSFVQCLSNTEDLNKYFLGEFYLADVNISNILKESLLKIYYDLLSQLWNGQEEMVSAKNLYPFIPNEKNDSQIICLLDFLKEMHKNLNRAPNMKINKIDKMEKKEEEETDKKASERTLKYNKNNNNFF